MPQLLPVAQTMEQFYSGCGRSGHASLHRQDREDAVQQNVEDSVDAAVNLVRWLQDVP